MKMPMLYLTRAPRAAVITGLLVAGLLPAGHAHAQERAPVVVLPASSLRLTQAAPIRESIAGIVDETAAAADLSDWKQSAALQVTVKPRPRSTGRKIAGGLIGGTAGLLAGGYLGAKLEGDCRCDIPGFRGALIGAPIGAVLGAIAGAKWF